MNPIPLGNDDMMAIIGESAEMSSTVLDNVQLLIAEHTGNAIGGLQLMECTARKQCAPVPEAQRDTIVQMIASTNHYVVISNLLVPGNAGMIFFRFCHSC